MYDADYENYNQELRREQRDGTPNYTTRDSGMKAIHADGVQRDTETGKPRFDLIWPDGVPFDDQLLTRVAWLYSRGADKYGARNWEKSETEETLSHHKAAFLRHVFKLYAGIDDGEDHAAAVVWNVNAIILTRRKIKAKEEAQQATNKLLGRETAGDSADLDYLLDMAEKHGFELVDKNSLTGTTQAHDPACPYHPTIADLKEEALKEETGPAGVPWTPWRQDFGGPSVTPCEYDHAGNKLDQLADEPLKLKDARVNADYLMDPRNWDHRTPKPSAEVNFVLTGFKAVSDIRWEHGDRIGQPGFSNGWYYDDTAGIWVSEAVSPAASPRSGGISLSHMVERYSPLKVLSGKYQGLVFREKGRAVSYEPE